MNPKFRLVDAVPIVHQGQHLVLLRDPLRLSNASIAVPRSLAPALSLLDGTRSVSAVEAALQIRFGLRTAPGAVARLLEDLDQAFLLENERYATQRDEALRAYRAAPCRAMTCAGSSYPPDPANAARRLEELMAGSLLPDEVPGLQSVRAVISPHIDYQRGGQVYAGVWRAAAHACHAAELAIIFGTDHHGGNGALTLTSQSYATPWGVLPTDAASVKALAAAIGQEAAFAEELHHRDEHSIELAVVWLHFARQGRPLPIVPILCGSFERYVAGDEAPGDSLHIETALGVLRDALGARRALVVAAADLAHMGPAFGDAYGLDFVGRAQMRQADERLLASLCSGDAGGFLQQIRAEGDRRHVCGLPPIYLTLRLLGDSRGTLTGYDLCPADPEGRSFVSVAGVTLE